MNERRRSLSLVLATCLALLCCRSAAPAGLRPAAPADDVKTGISLYQQGRYADAETALRSASGSEARAYLAASLAKQKKYAEAEAPAKEALAASPTHTVATAALGESLVGQKKLDEAIERMTRVLDADKAVAHAYFWRAQARYQKKQPDRMVDDFEAFLKLAPEAPEAAAVRQLLAGLR